VETEVPGPASGHDLAPQLPRSSSGKAASRRISCASIGSEDVEEIPADIERGLAAT
jgi:hypothetical protein